MRSKIISSTLLAAAMVFGAQAFAATPVKHHAKHVTHHAKHATHHAKHTTHHVKHVTHHAKKK